MTYCKDAIAILVGICGGKELGPSAADVRELRELGLIAPAPAGAGGDRLDEIRSRLERIPPARDQLISSLSQWEMNNPAIRARDLARREPDYKAIRDQLDALEKDERNLKRMFVDQVQSSARLASATRVNGEMLYVTYRGREVIGEIAQRKDRAGDMKLADILTELDAVKRHFEERSAAARRILERISPAFPKTDEIHLRMAAVGLSGRAGGPDEAAALFCHAFRSVSDILVWDDPSGVTLAETLVLRSKGQSELDFALGRAASLLKEPWEQDVIRDEQVRAVSIILACDSDPEKLAASARELLQYAPGWPSATAYLACSDPSPLPGRGVTGRLPAFLDIKQRLDNTGEPMPAAAVAAAVMADSGYTADEVMERFGRARQAFTRFNGSGMEVPAAMIAILPTGVDESLDNVRLASAAISRNRLSLGGAENLSLGVKLLVQSSVMAAARGEQGAGRPGGVPLMGSAPPVLALAKVSAATALAVGAGMLAFHQFGLHTLAVWDYNFHPVHPSYVYG